MAAFALTDVDLLAAGLDLSCFSSQLNVSITGSELESATFCSGAWSVPIVGMRSTAITASGPADMATATAAQTSAVDEILAVTIGDTYALSALPIGGTEGNVAYFTQGILTARDPISGSVGELATHQVTFAGNSPMVRGVLASQATVTATGNGTGHLLGAITSAQRMYAAVHVLTAGGTSTPTLTCKVQSDDNAGFTSATDRLTFTNFTAKGGQFGSVTGAVTDTYWRFAFTVSGTSPSFQVRAMLGIA